MHECLEKISEDSVWIAVSEMIEQTYEYVSDKQLFKLPAEISSKFIKGCTVADEFHYKQQTLIRAGYEERSVKIYKIVLVFPSISEFNEFVSVVNKAIIGTDYAFATNPTQISYHRLIGIIDHFEFGDYMFMTEEMKKICLENLQNIRQNKELLGPQGYYVDCITEDIEYIIQHATALEPKIAYRVS